MIGANDILRDKLDASLLAHFDALKQKEQVSVGDLYGLQFLCETHFYMKKSPGCFWYCCGDSPTYNDYFQYVFVLLQYEHGQHGRGDGFNLSGRG
ncbi:hypothetical protein LJC64_04175 [Ruminococcaceae bacterium OttesenSCG-928-A11]|nr:hypothetical protein [Ruminococcaceae bacterium OttesenSCG-928-A11]